MRPGHYCPGNHDEINRMCSGCRSFNEAGALLPRKFDHPLTDTIYPTQLQ